MGEYVIPNTEWKLIETWALPYCSVRAFRCPEEGSTCIAVEGTGGVDFWSKAVWETTIDLTTLSVGKIDKVYLKGMYEEYWCWLVSKNTIEFFLDGLKKGEADVKKNESPVWSDNEILLGYDATGKRTFKIKMTQSFGTSPWTYPALAKLHDAAFRVIYTAPPPPCPSGRGQIYGVILDMGSGKPLSGVKVRANSYGATTDAAGEYKVPVLPGTYTVTTSLVNYKEASRRITVPRECTSVACDFDLEKIVPDWIWWLIGGATIATGLAGGAAIAYRRRK